MAKQTKQQRVKLRQQKEAKKQKRTLLINILMAVVLLGGFSVLMIFRVFLSTGNPALLTIDGQTVSAQTANYYFRDSFDSFRSAYGDMIEAGKLYDSTKSLDSQLYAEDHTWADFFYESCRQTIIRGQLFGAEARAAGWVLPNEEQTLIEEKLRVLTDRARENSMSLESFLQSFYGKSATQESYEAYLNERAYAESYSKAYYAGLSYSHEQAEAYLAQQKDASSMTDEEAMEALADQDWTAWAQALEDAASIEEVDDPVKYFYCIP